VDVVSIKEHPPLEETLREGAGRMLLKAIEAEVPAGGAEAPGLSATTVVRLEQVWRDEHESGSKRSLAGQRFVSIRESRSSW
jgi:hypothetical protein